MARREFSIQDKQFLTENYLNLSIKEMADHLNRSLGVIQSKLSKMGLSKQQDLKIQRSSPLIGKEISYSPPELEGNKKDFFIIDFSEHNSLYQHLLQSAALEYRTPRQQILYLISKSIERTLEQP